MKLDEVDGQLLRLLQADNRRGIRQLAEAVQVSPPTCLRRMRRLRAQRVIRADSALVNPSKLGYDVMAFVEIVLHSTSSAALQRFEEQMRQHEYVLQCCEITGEVDYMLVVIARDLASFSNFTQQLLTANTNVAGLTTHLVMNSVKNEHQIPIG